MQKTRTAILALAAAGALWGLTVPLSKLSLDWLGAGWLTVLRFALAAPLLAVVGRRRLREALTPSVAAAGAIGFGAVILLQNAGIERTSVSHAALVVGAVPVLVALLVAALGQGAARPVAWAGYAIALAGLAAVAGAGGSGATLSGDVLVLASVALSATFVVAQPRLLAGRDPAAVTAVQFATGALVALPHALVWEGAPPIPAESAPVFALVALSLAGTLLPFWLFAHGQALVPADTAGAFLNLEPLVGAAAGWLAFGESAGAGQLVGAVAVLAGIALSTFPGRSREPVLVCEDRGGHDQGATDDLSAQPLHHLRRHRAGSDGVLPRRARRHAEREHFRRARRRPERPGRRQDHAQPARVGSGLHADGVGHPAGDAVSAGDERVGEPEWRRRRRAAELLGAAVGGWQRHRPAGEAGVGR
jgi:O-acetylserine/cysteine efflux transporter